ncbi:hypothetical protein A2774_03810 [Candidatus Roizmanbacteria bacterium RIFCSPHIGHO2_01_FULL_39_12c]|uniref:BioF2-like acetyltransferase domain-containing protein n=1 Tax=Candidatus Roizmanbacteria bacterium RIFCSPHIGHO2_01_FULL_39_12c TaxID=1802031 RepID=A0A1F7GEB2_9BACT|nr:MAG: hypothetical protein A2774_03810 [Candidatus Roizmanbacteria bacterium RIFCSPHIGHO2_01_FULL_39_12c]OGK47968.1 MAG: hypothetical protein A2963_00040 [Candidatus Roizmanbacteria bacterium RIFCSPLOWO2_01_FULL_40_13]
MKIQKIEENFNKNVFNQTATHPLQSWDWGVARKKTGIEVLRIGEFKSVETHSNASLQNIYQITLHKIPFSNYKIGYLPRSVFPSIKVLKFLYNYGKKNNLIFIKIEPYVFKSEIRNSKFEVNSKFKIISSKHPLFPNWTQIIDLTKSEEQLLNNMHPKTRYNIRLATKKGVTVKEMSNNEGFTLFQKLYFETTRRQRYFGHNYIYHKTVWENLKNKISHILIAYYQNIPLAAYQLFFFKNTLYYVYGGTSDQYRNLMASNLLMWESIRLGKKLGAKKIDLWGSLPPGYDSDHPWAGFTRFKEGYGGKFVELVGSYDLIINPLLYKFYDLALSLRNFYLRLH